MKVIKFIKVSNSKEEYYSDVGPVKSLLQAKQMTEDQASKVVKSMGSNINNYYNVSVEDYSKEFNKCQDDFQSAIDKAKELFKAKGFEV